MGTGGSSSGLKRPGRESDHFFASSALPFPQYELKAWCLMKHSDNFAFTIMFASAFPILFNDFLMNW